MNIVYIHSHDTGRYIEPYGHAVKTPNLMKLAQEGLTFRQAYCAGPTCSPSRAALLSGMAPHSNGMLGLAHLGFQMHDYERHLVRFLSRNGYETVLAGIQHEAPEIEMLGYDHIAGKAEVDMANFAFDSVKYDSENADAAAAYIKEQKPGGKPFFLSYGMFNTHLNFPPTDEGVSPAHVMPPFPIHDNDQTRQAMAGFLTSAQVMDRCAGRVIDAIKEAGLEGETAVLYTTDHGLPFPMMKCSLYDTGIGVALIIRTPERLRQGEAEDALVSHLDVFPTLCEMAGLTPPSWLQGHSLMPLLHNEAERIRDEIYAEITYHVDYEPSRCIRTERYKYMQHFGERRDRSSANLDNSEVKTFLVEHDLLEQSRPDEMLFDLYLDPAERINLAQEASYGKVKETLAGKLFAWMQTTDDPLLEGADPMANENLRRRGDLS